MDTLRYPPFYDDETNQYTHTSMYNVDTKDTTSSIHPNCLHYLNNNTNNLFTPQEPSSIDLMDYKQEYGWLYDPLDPLLPVQNSSLFCDDNMLINFPEQHPLDYIMASEPTMNENAIVEGGLSCDYVNLSDVNSFVAKADKQLLEIPIQNRDFLSSSESANDDSEDEYSDNEGKMHWPTMIPYNASTKQKFMIKLKKSHDSLPSPYGDWDSMISKSTGYRKYRKSMSNIYQAKKTISKGRRGSAPNRLTIHQNASTSSLHSSSSLCSLTNKLRVSDGLCMSDEEENDDEDDDDDEFQLRSAPMTSQAITKKGRNVDKACNHCKRSHLRCDEMRPCRRCVATGKTGCKDVQHKPRGRPKLHKK